MHKQSNLKKAYASHDYIMKIVPTIYEDVRGNQMFPFQYTYAHRVREWKFSINFIQFNYKPNKLNPKQKRNTHHSLTADLEFRQRFGLDTI